MITSADSSKGTQFQRGHERNSPQFAEIKHCVTFCRTQEEFLNIRIEGTPNVSG
ncbi:hypothetical protein ACVXHA_13110 [Escherichia coli]